MNKKELALSDIVCKLEIRIELLDAKIANKGYTKEQKLADVQKLREYGQQLRDYIKEKKR